MLPDHKVIVWSGTFEEGAGWHRACDRGLQGHCKVIRVMSSSWNSIPRLQGIDITWDTLQVGTWRQGPAAQEISDRLAVAGVRFQSLRSAAVSAEDIQAAVDDLAYMHAVLLARVT